MKTNATVRCTCGKTEKITFEFDPDTLEPLYCWVCPVCGKEMDEQNWTEI